MKKNVTTWIIILVSLLPAGYLAAMWQQLPATVPVHFGADFKPDRFGSKNELLLITGILAVVSIGLYFLLNNLHRFDPKRKGAQTSSTFQKLSVGLVVFMASLGIVIIESARGTIEVQSLLFPMIGVMFAFIGNYMHTIKPNYFAGIRLPWTLSSDENWRRTHQVGGKIWFAGGLMIAVAGLLLAQEVLIPVFITILAVMVLVPTIYSYRLFRQQQQHN